MCRLIIIIIIKNIPLSCVGKLSECKGGNEGAIDRQVTSQRIRGTELVSLREMPPTRETIPPEVKANAKF